MIDLTALHRRYEELVRALDAMSDETPYEERAALRRKIVELYRELDGTATRVMGMREAVQGLGERFRRTFAPLPEQSADEVQGGDEAAMRRSDDLDVSTYLDRAWNCLATCRYEDALQEVSRALERVPGSLQAETLRGWALMRLDRLDEAREILEEVLRTNGAAALARASLGYVAFREERYSEAIDHLARAARDATDRKAVLYAHLYLGMLYTRREMFRDGRSFLTRALELGPSLVEAYWEMGRSYYLEGQFTQALEAWKRGAEVNRFDPWGERCHEAVERATGGAPVLLE